MKSNVKRDYFVLWIGLFFLGLVAAMIVMVASVSAQAIEPAQLRLLQSDAGRVVVELEIPSYVAREQIVDGQAYTVLSVPDLGQTGEAGRPQLPVKGALIGIPVGARATLEVLDDWVVRQPLAHPPLPVPALQVNRDLTQMLPPEPERRFILDESVYLGQQLYPTQAARIASVGQWRSQRTLTVVFHPLQYDPAARQLVWHRRLRVEITFQYEQGAIGALTGAEPAGRPGEPVDEGAFEPVLSQALLNYASAQDWRVATPSESPGPAGAMAAPGPWYKIAVNADGIYTLTCSQLDDAGIDLASLDPRTLKIYKGENELAIHVVGEADGVCHPNDYVEFFGQAVNTKYTNTNVYWLTYGGVVGKRIVLRDGGGTGSLSTTFSNTIHLEQDKLYRSYTPAIKDADHWFWNYLPDRRDGDGNGDPNSADYVFYADNLASGDFTATLQVSFAGFGINERHAYAYVNGHLVADATWSGRNEHYSTIPFPQSYLTAFTNTVRVSETGVAGDAIFVNHFDIGYTSAFTATNDARRFGQTDSGAWQYQIAGFTTPDVETFDVSDPGNVTRIISTTVTMVDSVYMLQFTDGITSPHEYLALTPAQRKRPVGITRDAPSDLRNPSNGADYIIISYGGFITNVQPLANYRAAQGMRVQVVDVQDVYDEFGDGLMDAQAIRDFLAYAYANWRRPAPQFVLLVGDGTLDPKSKCATPGACAEFTTPPNSTLIPPYLGFVDPEDGETASDNRFVAFNIPNNALPFDPAVDNTPQMAIGRLPADSAADVDAMVSKILNYEQNPAPGPWRSTVTFVADNTYEPDGTRDKAGDFWDLSDRVASNPLYMPPPTAVDRVYYNPCDPQIHSQCALPYSPPYTTDVSARQAVTTAINDGRLIVNYVGHGAIQSWAHDLLSINSVNALSNGARLPVMLDMTCRDGYFQFPNYPSLAEVSVRRAGNGALASWAASGQGVAEGHDYLDQGFFDAVMQHQVYQIGLAADWGKLNLWTNSGGANHDLIDTFNLFGDPASRLAVSPDVAIAKTVSPQGQLLIGAPITFTLAFSNAGVLPARDVVITDLLANTLLTPTVSFSSSTPLAPTATTLLGWNAGTLGPGQGGIITIAATLDPVSAHWWATVLTNTATITTSSQQNDITNDQSTTSTPIRLPAPDVALVKTVSPGGVMFIGTPITYTLAFTNIGQLTADNVMISDLLPATLLTPQVVSSGVPVTRTGSTRLEWTVGSLPPGTGGLITIAAMLDPVGAHWPSAWLTNTATITTTLPQSDMANDWSVTVTPVRFPIYLPVVLRQ